MSLWNWKTSSKNFSIGGKDLDSSENMKSTWLGVESKSYNLKKIGQYFRLAAFLPEGKQIDNVEIKK